MELEDILQGLEAKTDQTLGLLNSIPTGSLGLDLALGGGYHRGKIVELSGDFSTYKTVFALHTVAQAQKFGRVLWLDSGSDFNPKHAQRFGVNLDLLTVCFPADVDRAMYTMRISSPDYALMVLDSASGLDWDNELTPPMIDRSFLWLTNDIRAVRTTALFISNHFATKDQRFTQELRKWSVQQVRMYPQPGKGLVQGIVTKNASGPPLSYRINLRFGKDAAFDHEYELVKLAEEIGLIEVRGSWAYFQGEKLGQGVRGSVSQLRNHPGYALNIRDAIRTELS